MPRDQLDHEIQNGLQAMWNLQEHYGIHGDEPQEDAWQTRKVLEGELRNGVYRILLASESEQDPLDRLDSIAASASTPSCALGLKERVIEAQDARYSAISTTTDSDGA